MLAQLSGAGGNSATVSELAQPHGMSLPGFMKHLAVLEAAGLIARSKEGRVVRCELDAAALHGAASWLDGAARDSHAGGWPLFFANLGTFLET